LEVEMTQQKLFNEKITLQELEQYLWKVEDMLRESIEVSKYKNSQRFGMIEAMG
jgi:type I restriction-modification system DNA methylase subunit